MALTLLSRSDKIQFASRGRPGRDAAIEGSAFIDRPGDAPNYFTRSVAGGSPENLLPLAQDIATIDDDGQVIRLTGEDRVVARFFTAIQPGRLYKLRYVARRRSNSPDPDNDAIRFGVLWYDQARSPLAAPNDVTVIEDMLGVTVGDGRIDASAMLSRESIFQDSIIPPPGARYAKPFTQTYGTTQRTDVEVVGIYDVSDVNLYAPDVSAFDGRVAALESVDAGDRLAVLEQSVAQPVTKRYAVLADAVADNIPAFVDIVETQGISAPGTGGALYARATGRTLGGFQSADGAWWQLANEDMRVASYGALASAPDNLVSIQAALDAAKDGGQEVMLGRGQYRVDGPLIIDYAAEGGESVNPEGLWGVNLRGKGQRATNLLSGEAEEYALRVIGGTGVASHFYTTVSDLSVGRAVTGAHGISLFNQAFAKLENITAQGLRVGLHLESVLSSKFDTIVMGNCDYGTEVLKGAGFSDINANKWDKCIWRLNSRVGYAGGPHCGLYLDACQFEGNGTPGDLLTGGADLTFNGAEGATGLVMTGGYVEANAGGWDFNLVNTGPFEIVHTFIGVNFNRVGSRFPINHVRTANTGGGRTRLVFIGCTFQHLSGYAPSADRLMVNADANTTVECFGCSIPNTVDRGNLYNIGENPMGHVPATGTPSTFPAGWVLERPAEGVYLVRHNLGIDPSRCHANVTCTSAVARRLQRVTMDPNYFAPVIEGGDGVPANGSFSFELIVRR